MILSICILTYNRAQYLNELLLSIIDSAILDTPKVELIILDNGSTDDTKDVLNKFSRTLEIQIITKEQNMLGGQTYLELFSHSKAEWILCPGDDDILVPKALKSAIEVISMLEDHISLAAFEASVVDKSGIRKIGSLIPPSIRERERILAELMYKNIYAFPATFFRRRIIDQNKAPKSIVTFDWWLWISGITDGDVHIENLQIVKYRQHEAQEQNSYLKDMWLWDRVLSFLFLINESTINDWLHQSSRESIVQFVHLLSLQFEQKESLSHSDRLLTVLILIKCLNLHKNTHDLIQPKLVKLGVDPRLIGVLEGTIVTERDFLNALLRLNPSYENQRQDNLEFSNAKKLRIHQEFLAELTAKREIEKASEVSTFEWRVLRCMRRLKRLQWLRSVAFLVFRKH
jgi:hypothetical protein